MIEKPYKNAKEAIQDRIDRYGRWMKIGFIEENKRRLETHAPNPDYDLPTMENVTIAPDLASDWNAMTVMVRISGQPASVMTFTRALELALQGMAVDLAANHHEAVELARDKITDAVSELMLEAFPEKFGNIAKIEGAQRVLARIGEDGDLILRQIVEQTAAENDVEPYDFSKDPNDS